MISKRHADILKILDSSGTVTVAQLANLLGVSTETVRRDLRPLVEDGAVHRMHGAVSLTGPTAEAPFRRRMRENAPAKQAIAARVAATILDGQTVMLDTGTTTSFIARALTGHRRLRVVTNSMDVARTLAVTGGNRVFLTAGEVRPDSGAALGPAAVAHVLQFRADVAVISAGGVDALAVTDYDPDEAEFARALLTCAPRRVVATDATKFGRRGLVAVVGFDGMDELVTDAAPPAVIASAMAAGGARLVLAG